MLEAKSSILLEITLKILLMGFLVIDGASSGDFWLLLMPKFAAEG
jgi:hypothetical protein